MSDERKDTTDGEAPRGDRWLERLMQRFGTRPRDSIRDDLEEVLAEATQAPDFSPHERAMLKNVLGFHRVRVSDVMVPRADIVSVAAETSLGRVLSLFRTAAHSRLPAYGETLDEPLGMVHIRDLVDFITAGAETTPEPGAAADDVPELRSLGRVDLSVSLSAIDILRPVLFVPRSMPAIDLLVRMQASRTHMALVIDEYGGTDGLVSIEDLVESVVGDIEDEHDETTDTIVHDDRGGVLIDARASLEEVAEALGQNLSVEIEADEVDTIGGLVVLLAGRVPSRGELIAGPHGLEFEIIDADPRRLKRVRIQSRPLADAAALDAASPNATASADDQPPAPPPASEADRPH